MSDISEARQYAIQGQPISYAAAKELCHRVATNCRAENHESRITNHVPRYTRRISSALPTMTSNILCPQPKRPYKRAIAQINSDLNSRLGTMKKRHRLQSPSFEPDSQPQVTRAISISPWSTCAPGRPQLPTYSPIDAWISAVFSPARPISPKHRPSTCPAVVDVRKGKHLTPSLATLQRSHFGAGANVTSGTNSSQNGQPGTSHFLYRGTLYNNYINLDYSGRQMPEEWKTFTNNQILKQRESPQLGDKAVSKVIDTAKELADSTEGPTAKLIRTDMFHFDRPGLAEGGNSPWSTVALPNNPEYQYDVSAPKPDTTLGYPTNQRSGWSYAQSNVVTHPVARPYTSPARGNTFPFLMVEMKSEAAGGTIYVAENQAAGSGSHSVNALLWLLQKFKTYGNLKTSGNPNTFNNPTTDDNPETSDNSSLTDTIAFTITMSHRQAIFYLHWYSESDRHYYMFFLKSYSSVTPTDIRACNNTVKNIIDHGLGARRTTIGTALEALFPFPQHWKQARLPPSTTPSTL